MRQNQAAEFAADIDICQVMTEKKQALAHAAPLFKNKKKNILPSL